MATATLITSFFMLFSVSSQSPSLSPTIDPSYEPTLEPTNEPTAILTSDPTTKTPTMRPIFPTKDPTISPSVIIIVTNLDAGVPSTSTSLVSSTDKPPKIQSSKSSIFVLIIIALSAIVCICGIVCGIILLIKLRQRDKLHDKPDPPHTEMARVSKPGLEQIYSNSIKSGNKKNINKSSAEPYGENIELEIENTGTGSSQYRKDSKHDVSSRFDSNPKIPRLPSENVSNPSRSPNSGHRKITAGIVTDDDDTPDTAQDTGSTGDTGNTGTGTSGGFTGSSDDLDVPRRKHRKVTDDGSGNKKKRKKKKEHQRTDSEIMRDWLENVVGLPEYYQLLVGYGYESLHLVKEIDRNEMKEIGIMLRAHQTKLLAEIKRLKMKDMRQSDSFIPHQGSGVSLEFGNHDQVPSGLNVSNVRISKKKHIHKKIYSDDQYIYEGNDVKTDGQDDHGMDDYGYALPTNNINRTSGGSKQISNVNTNPLRITDAKSDKNIQRKTRGNDDYALPAGNTRSTPESMNNIQSTIQDLERGTSRETDDAGDV